MDYCAFKLRLKDVTSPGITITARKVCLGDQAEIGEWITFELKKNLKEQPTSVLYKDNLYLVDSREANLFNCIAIKLEGV